MELQEKPVIYVVDANNLAGQLRTLREPDFDVRLACLCNDFLDSKDDKSEVWLVFDGYDAMGEKYQSGRVTLVRAPIDSRTRNADDKVVDLALRLSADKSKSVTVVTNDLEIGERLGVSGFFEQKNTAWIRARDFAAKLDFLEDSTDKIDNMDDVTNELMDLWDK